MVDSFTRPYVNNQGELEYLTDEQFVQRSQHTALRKLRPGEVIAPSVDPISQVAPSTFVGGEAADTAPTDPHVPNPTLEVREREDV